MKIVMDCGNGVAGGIARRCSKRLGCELVELFCEVDGNFPNHHPDPSKPENLQDVIRALIPTPRSASPSTVTATASASSLGRRDHLTRPPADALRRRRALARASGEIIYDVKCTRLLAPLHPRTRRQKPTMWQTGHALIKKKLKTGARSPAR